MIYYLIIPNNAVIDNSAANSLHGSAIKNHSELGNKAPNIVNEMQCSIVITDVNCLKKINFTDSDEVRLCLQYDNQRYGIVKHNFDINNVQRTLDIYNFLKAKELKVNPTVVYI